MRLALLVVVALVLGFVLLREREARAHEARLGKIATEIAGRKVSVHCQGRFGALLDVASEDGSVRFDASGRPADHTDLKRHVCTTLARLADDPDRGDEATVLALNTLAHESWHLAGEQNEAVAECHAVQTIALVARRLGVRDAGAQTHARTFLATYYPRQPDSYRTHECRDGGPLDLRPADPVWP